MQYVDLKCWLMLLLLFYHFGHQKAIQTLTSLTWGNAFVLPVPKLGAALNPWKSPKLSKFQISFLTFLSTPGGPGKGSLRPSAPEVWVFGIEGSLLWASLRGIVMGLRGCLRDSDLIKVSAKLVRNKNWLYPAPAKGKIIHSCSVQLIHYH